MKLIRVATLLFYILPALFPNCASLKKSSALTIEQLQAAPDTVDIAGQKMVLQTYLWRDFMPNSPPDGKPLKASVFILPADGSAIRTNFDANKIWVIFRQQVWSADLQGVGNNLPAAGLGRLEKTADGGPKWQPGSRVTVVVRLVKKDGKTVLLKAGNQMIKRTD